MIEERNEQVFLMEREMGEPPIVVNRHEEPAEEEDEENVEAEGDPTGSTEEDGSDAEGADGEAGEGGEDSEGDPDQENARDEAEPPVVISDDLHRQAIDIFTQELPEYISDELKGHIKGLTAQDIYQEGLSQVRTLAMIAEGGAQATAEVLAAFAARIAAHAQASGMTEDDMIPFTPEDVSEKFLDEDSLSDFERKLVLTIEAVHARNLELQKLALHGAEKVKEAIERSIKNQTDATILGSLSKAFPGEKFNTEQVRKAMVQFGVADPVNAMILQKAGEQRKSPAVPRGGKAQPSGGTPTKSVVTKAELDSGKMSIGDLFLRLSNGEVIEE